MLAWVLASGASEPVLADTRAENPDRFEAQAAGEWGPAHSGAEAGEGKREAAGPPQARIEVRGELPDGSVVTGPTVRYLADAQEAGIATQSEDGRTYVMAPQGTQLRVEVLWSVEGTKVDYLEGTRRALVEEDAVWQIPLHRVYTRIHGTVVRDGFAEAGVVVKLQSGAYRETQVTDEHGQYEFVVDRAIDGRISFGAGPTGKVTLGDGHRPEYVEELQVPEGEVRQVDAVLPGGALRLLVTDQADRPQRHAVWVTVSPAKASLDGGIALDRTEVTDGDGVASFRGLPRGEYWVRIGAFTNRPTPPSRLRVYHPGGIHEQTVQMPGLAQLRLVAYRKVAGGLEQVQVPAWVIERDGGPYQPWDEEFTTAIPPREGLAPRWQRVSAGNVRLRVGDSEHGYADLDLSLPTGAKETAEVVLESNGPLVQVSVPHELFAGRRRYFVADAAGRWVATVTMERSEYSKRIELQLEGDAVIRDVDLDLSNLPGRQTVTVRLPEDGHYFFFKRVPDGYRKVGDAVVHGDSSVPILLND